LTTPPVSDIIPTIHTAGIPMAFKSKEPSITRIASELDPAATGSERNVPNRGCVTDHLSSCP
jgi:hypothetical protein